MKNFLLPKIWLLLLVLAAPALAQTDLSKPIPFDPNVKKGKLANGLTYYIRKNVEPKDRAELRLAIKAGSILETDEQQGLAHFMEHMNFNGTKNFPKNELVDFLQKSGVRFGADLNAYTGFDETVYMLPIPTDSAGLLEKGLQVLEDWAHNALFDPEEVDKERGVVLEESRSGRGAQQRMRDQYFKMILNNSRYAERLPIGKDDILKDFKPEVLKQFHTDWYRPDLMAVIAVGDFDPAEVEKIIKNKFGSIPMPKTPKKRTDYKIPLDGATNVAIVTDAEYPQNLVQVIYKQPEFTEKTLKDARTQLSYQLFNAMLGARLQELTRQADPPFLFGGGNYGGFLGDLDAFTSIALAKTTDGVEKSLQTLLEENARVQKFGFTQSELDRAKSSYLNGIERSLKEKDKTRSDRYVQQYIDNFLNDGSAPGIEFQSDFVKKEIDGIKLAEVNKLASQFITDKNRAVVILGPEKAKDQLPTEAKVKELLATAGKNVTAYVDDTKDEPLLPTEPKGTKVVSEKKLDDRLGVTELTLGNGVKVLLKPTDFKNDQILFKATGKGGTSLFPKDLETGDFASYLIGSGGVGSYSQTQLQKFLAGKTVNVRPYVSELSEGVSGSTNPKDLETALQLMYAYFTAPRKDEPVAQGILSSQKSYLENMMKTPTPEKIFSDTLNAVMTSYDPRREPLTPERVDKVNLDRAMEIYKDRFKDASDFVFTFVGAFKVDEIKPMIEKYIGGLPSTDRDDSYNDPDIRPMKGRVERTVYKGTEPKSRVSLMYTGDYDYNPENNVQIEAIQEVLQIKLIEALREEESGVYGVGVSESTDKYPSGHYRMSIGFGCAPENVDKLVQRTKEEIEKLKKNGAEQKDIEKFVAETSRQTQVQLKTNEFWRGYLDNAIFENEDLLEVFNEEKHLKEVTVASTKAAAQKYLDDSNFIKVVLMPEK
ncbi:M16 family metallopeptidase [Persicitalea sp.]|uniref:M16 family metallopeptidase n=1 Tax=Persicitalea sp. TaxID=3100273 RepID=UPI0035942341